MVQLDRHTFRILPALVVLCLALDAGTASGPQRPYPGKTWQMYESPEEAGFSGEKLKEIRAVYDKSGAAALLVIHDGRVLVAWGDFENRFMCHSIRKSFLSALYGCHVGEGRLNTGKTLAELGIDDSEPALTDAEKQARVVDLLGSRSGIYHAAAYEPASMKANRPPRGTHPPGAHWWYNNWDFNALLTIFEKETGKKIFEEFQKRFAEPLGMQDFRLRDGYYHREPDKSNHPAYPFRMSARDLARFGLLMMRGGRWGDREIVPEDWVRESTRRHSKTGRKDYSGYGYLWLVAGPPLEKYRTFSALGDGENSIDVLPKRDLVFVFRADTYHGKKIARVTRLKILQSIVEAQTGEPKKDPALVPLPPAPPRHEEFGLAAKRLEEFPLELRPVVGKPVRIRRVDESLVLYVGEPSGLNFDLLPIADDRFFIEGVNEIGVIQRDAGDRPTAFLLESHLIRAGQDRLAKGDIKGALLALSPIGKHFSTSAVGRLWLGEAYRAQGDKARALGHYLAALELSKGDASADRQLRNLPLLIRSLESKTDPASLDAFVGRYELSGGKISTVARQGHRLLIRSPNGNWSALVPATETTFRLLENSNVRCEFVRDDDGQVTRLIVFVGHQRLEHRRVGK